MEVHYKYMCTCGYNAGIYAKTMYLSQSALQQESPTSLKSSSAESLALRKKYEAAIFDNKEEFKHRTRLLEKDNTESLDDKDRAIGALRKVIMDLERQQREMAGGLGMDGDGLRSNLTKSTLQRLVDQIELLQGDKQKLLRKLTEYKVTGSEDLLAESPIFQRKPAQIVESQHQTPVQGHSEPGENEFGPCTTDTEKELEQSLRRKDKLESEVMQLRQENRKLQHDLSKFSTPDANHNFPLHRPATNRTLFSEPSPPNLSHGEDLELPELSVVSVESQTNSQEESRVVRHEDIQSQCESTNVEVVSLRAQVETLQAELQRKTEELIQREAELNAQISQLIQDKEDEVQETQNKMAAEITRLTESNANMAEVTRRVVREFEHVKESYETLRGQMIALPLSLSQYLTHVQQQVKDSLSQLASANREVVQKYLKEMRLRKKFHNQLVELRGNIRVLCRIRPCIAEDDITDDLDLVVTPDLQDDGMVKVNYKSRVQAFDFDKVFGIESTQPQVFDEVSSLVRSVIDGYNVCIFAYGQTGSGKTYTMEGPEGNPGINQRSLQVLFEETQDGNWEYNISASVMEIYNEVIRDLLNPDPGNRLEVKMKPEGGFHVPGLETRPVASLEECNQVFLTGRQNRATASTNMNEHSSRSHCLLCITVSGFNLTTGHSTFGRLNLVDLAGSERVSKSNADGARLKEAQNINRSLACLGDVIHALRSKRSHVPYRNSKLTYLLQDSLGGDSKTLMIVQVAPVEKNVAESLCTLSFGQRVKAVELGPAHSRSFDGSTSNRKSSSAKKRKTTRPSSLNISSSCSSLNSSFRSTTSSSASSPSGSFMNDSIVSDNNISYNNSRSSSPLDINFCPVFSSSTAPSPPSSSCATPTPGSPRSTHSPVTVSTLPPVPPLKLPNSSHIAKKLSPGSTTSSASPKTPTTTGTKLGPRKSPTPNPARKGSTGLNRSATFTTKGSTRKKV